MARSLLLLLALGGCAGPDYSTLFDVTAPPPGTSLFGLWGTEAHGGDLRWRIDPDQITMAQRCGATIVGLEADARVDDEAIRIYDSKHAGSACFVTSSFSLLTRCSFDPLGGCFTHTGRALTVDVGGETFVMTKVAD